MIRLEKLAAAVAVLALACSADVPTGAVLSTAPLAASRGESQGEGKVKAITGTCDSRIVSVEPLSPTTAREIVVGPCTISHIGRVTLYLRQVIDFSTGRAVSEQVTFTTRKGDVLRATSITQGTPTGPTTFSLAGTFVFTGGTGRFADASGGADFTGTANFATGTALLTLHGRIANAKGSDDDDD